MTMLRPDTTVFFRVPDISPLRILYPAAITGQKNDTYQAVFRKAPDKKLNLAPGEKFFIYYHLYGEFVQQTARLNAVSTDAPRTVVVFITLGEPVTAERRQCRRYALPDKSLSVLIDSRTNCRLFDISAAGFAIVTAAALKSDQRVMVSLAFRGQSFHGRAVVRHAGELPGGKIRYGLHALEDESDHARIQEGLLLITEAILEPTSR